MLSNRLFNFCLVLRASPYYPLKILHNDEELPEGRFSIESGARLQRLRVVLSDQGAVVRGAVHQAKGDKPAAGIWVSVVPVEAERKGSEWVRSGRTDQQGHFVVEGIAPGRYFVPAYRDYRSLPANPSALEALAAEHANLVPIVELKSRSQKEMRLGVID